MTTFRVSISTSVSDQRRRSDLSQGSADEGAVCGGPKGHRRGLHEDVRHDSAAAQVLIDCRTAFLLSLCMVGSCAPVSSRGSALLGREKALGRTEHRHRILCRDVVHTLQCTQSDRK